MIESEKKQPISNVPTSEEADNLDETIKDLKSENDSSEIDITTSDILSYSEIFAQNREVSKSSEIEKSTIELENETSVDITENQSKSDYDEVLFEHPFIKASFADRPELKILKSIEKIGKEFDKVLKPINSVLIFDEAGSIRIAHDTNEPLPRTQDKYEIFASEWETRALNALNDFLK